MSWDIFEAGPADAAKTVLLLPGGMCSARSYAEVVAQPILARVRLIAVTLPGHAGTPPLEDFSTETCARAMAELARTAKVDVIVGFSMGATVAYEMVVSRGFTGPVVLLGVSLSEKDEPAFFRVIVQLGSVLGTLPVGFLKTVAASMVQRIQLPPGRLAELKADFARNDSRCLQRGLQARRRQVRASNPIASGSCGSLE